MNLILVRDEQLASVAQLARALHRNRRFDPFQSGLILLLDRFNNYAGTTEYSNKI